MKPPKVLPPEPPPVLPIAAAKWQQHAKTIAALADEGSQALWPQRIEEIRVAAAAGLSAKATAEKIGVDLHDTYKLARRGGIVFADRAVPLGRPPGQFALQWSDAAVDTLKRLHAEGLSASQIAAQLGGGITRNAVIGKVHRLQLSGLAKPAKAAAAPRKPRAAQHIRPSVIPVRPRHVPAPPSAMSQFPASVDAAKRDTPVEPTSATRVSLLDLTSANCHWPNGDPQAADFHFCGAEAEAGKAYCSWHCGLAYQAGDAGRRRAEAIAA